MKRRTVLLGASAGVAGVGALLGAGAVSQVVARRRVTVETASDDAALLTLEPGSGDVAGFVSQQNGVLTVDVDAVDNGATTPGAGLNDGGVTALRNLVRVTNGGSQAVTLSADVPPNGGVVLITGYDGPTAAGIQRLEETRPTLPAEGGTTELGLAFDAGYGTDEIPGTIGDGDSVTLVISAST